MKSAASSRVSRAPRHGIAASFFWAVAFALPCGLVAHAGAQTKAQTGQWSQPPFRSPVDFIVAHMALLPGDASYHSRIVMWDHTDSHLGAEFAWNSGADSCDAWPYSLSRLDWNPPVNLTYAGHAQLATSPGLLMVGGLDGLAFVGIPDAQEFTPGTGAIAGCCGRRRATSGARSRASTTCATPPPRASATAPTRRPRPSPTSPRSPRPARR